MSAITEFLYPTPAKRTVGGIVKWWEKRRLAYNVAVGSAGVLSLATTFALLALPPNGQLVSSFEWLPGVVVFGVMANVCYLFGPTIEVLVHKIWGRQLLPTGPALYRVGLTFSVGLALFPALISMFLWVARIVVSIF
jgi:hypothetical protein